LNIMERMSVRLSKMGPSDERGPETLTPAGHRATATAARGARQDHFFSGSSFFLSLPSMNGLQGWALIGPLVFQTTLNWPSARTSPISTGLCRWCYFSSILSVKPLGAAKVWPAMAAITLTGAADLDYSTTCFHTYMPT